MTLKGESHEGMHRPRAKLYSVEQGSGRDACIACKRHSSPRVGYSGEFLPVVIFSVVMGNTKNGGEGWD